MLFTVLLLLSSLSPPTIVVIATIIIIIIINYQPPPSYLPSLLVNHYLTMIVTIIMVIIKIINTTIIPTIIDYDCYNFHHCRQTIFLLLPTRESSLDDAEPPSPHYPKHALTIHSPFYGASTDDARGFSTVGYLAKSPTPLL